MKRLVIVYIGVFISALIASGCGKATSTTNGNNLPPNGGQSAGSTSSSSAAVNSGSIKSQVSCVVDSTLDGAAGEFEYIRTFFSDGSEYITCGISNFYEHSAMVAPQHVASVNGKCTMGAVVPDPNGYPLLLGSAVLTFQLATSNISSVSFTAQDSTYSKSPVNPTSIPMTCTTENF